MKKQNFEFEINGLRVDATYSEESVEHLWKPLLRKLHHLQESKQRRILVYLVAPPAVGKSTLAYFLESLSRQMEGIQRIQSIGLDGFHFPQEIIAKRKVILDGKEVDMKDVKGCPETFNIKGIIERITEMKQKDVKWPIYDRTLHDVIDNQIDVVENIVLIEGNWLLLKDESWKELKNYCDFSLFIDAEESMLKQRLIQRKMRGGLSLEEAKEFYERSDSKNVLRVKKDSQSADLELKLLNNGEFENKKGCNTYE